MTATEKFSRDLEVRFAETGFWQLGYPRDTRHEVPFLRVVGALRDWTTGSIADGDFARSLRKAATEIARG